MSKIVKKIRSCAEEDNVVRVGDKYYIVSMWDNAHTSYSIEVKQGDKDGNIINEKMLYITSCLGAFKSHPLLPDINSLSKKREWYGEMDVYNEVCNNLEKYLKK